MFSANAPLAKTTTAPVLEETLRIDPHTHSNCSDGTDTPTQLIANAVAAGLDVVGLTDHDTVQGWTEAADTAIQKGITLLRGSEFS